MAILQEDRQKYITCGTTKKSISSWQHSEKIFNSFSRYSHLLKQLQRENCSHLIVTIDYDKSQFSGPPRCVPVQEIEQLFGGIELNEMDLRT